MSSFHILTYLGSTPCEEECSQAGEDDFARLNRLECRTFIDQLQRLFPIPAELEGKVEYGMQAEHHDFGTYREVVIKGLGNIPQVATFASLVESKAPTHWDHPARVKLALGLNYEPRYTDALIEMDLERTITHTLINADPQAEPIPFDPLNEKQSNSQSPLLNADGNPYRCVLIPPQLVEQQVIRYSSHSHQVYGADEWTDAYLQLVESAAQLGK